MPYFEESHQLWKVERTSLGRPSAKAFFPSNGNGNVLLANYAA